MHVQQILIMILLNRQPRASDGTVALLIFVTIICTFKGGYLGIGGGGRGFCYVIQTMRVGLLSLGKGVRVTVCLI